MPPTPTSWIRLCHLNTWDNLCLKLGPTLSPTTYFFKGGGPRVVVSTAAFHVTARGSIPGLGGLKETKMFLPHPRVKVSIVGSLRDREVALSASDRQGSNFETCAWRTVSSHSSHYPHEVILAQFSLYVHKGGLKPDSFHFTYFFWARIIVQVTIYRRLLIGQDAISTYQKPTICLNLYENTLPDSVKYNKL